MEIKQKGHWVVVAVRCMRYQREHTVEIMHHVPYRATRYFWERQEYYTTVTESVDHRLPITYLWR